MNDAKRAISKILSANDAGETGGHQAGILIPKRPPGILGFFPPLDNTSKNPRYHLPFYDDCDARWEFAFIYYNGKFFEGTRNEFRLTGMTKYLRSNDLQPGDELILERDEEGMRHIRYIRARKTGMGSDGVLRLGSSWKVIDI